jgi:hypothetical protein
MIVNNPANAGLTPGPGISLEILSNSFSALTAVSFATEPLVVGAVSERDGIAFELVGAATEVAMLDAMSAASIAERSVRGCLARDGARFGVGVLESCCWTRLGLDEEGCDSGDLCFPSFLNIADNFGGMNDFGMMNQNKELEHEAAPSRRQAAG